MKGTFFVCSTDESHDMIGVLSQDNGFAHGFFEHYEDAKKNAMKTAKNSGSYYVENAEEEYIILQDIESDVDYLVLRHTVAKALELANETIIVDDVLNETEEQMYVLTQLLWTDSVKAKRDCIMRKKARGCRNSKNNIVLA